MTTIISQPPPSPLRGWVNTFYRHYNGKKLGPYHVRRWKVGRKIHREYVKPDQVEQVKAACLAYRERQRARKDHNRKLNIFIDNFNYLGAMMNRYDRGKVVTPAMEAYILRLNKEGMQIKGRPQLRRRVTRTLAKIAGQTYVVKTAFELDGTTKVFMVPFIIKSPLERLKAFFDQIIDEAFHGKRDPERPGNHHNIWLESTS
jgi:hypothetical protein